MDLRTKFQFEMMNELSRTKKFDIRFPRRILERALQTFLEEAQIPPHENPSYISATVERNGESLRLPSASRFFQEYDNNASGARLHLLWNKEDIQAGFLFHFHARSPSTCMSEIEITHLAKPSIKKVFRDLTEFAIETKKNNQISSYKLEEGLPSCNVTPHLLKKLEQLIISNFDQASERSTTMGSPVVEIRLSDSSSYSSGCETLTSIDNYKREFFPDSIKRIQVGLALHLSDEIMIQFDRERAFTTLRITTHSTTSRSDAKKIADQILQILSDHRNGNWFFSPPIPVAAALIMVSWISVGLGIAFLVSSKWLALGLGTASLGIQAYVNLQRIKPYSEFHTKQNELISKWFNWFVFAAAEFGLFATLGTIVVQKILTR